MTKSYTAITAVLSTVLRLLAQLGQRRAPETRPHRPRRLHPQVPDYLRRDLGLPPATSPPKINAPPEFDPTRFR